MRHDVVSGLLFYLCNAREIYVVRIPFKLLYLRSGNRQPQLVFAFGKRDPDFAPCGIPVLCGENGLHFL